MKLYRKNPRQITDKQFSQLQKELRKLGDLSGVVHDLNSDEVIGGNQRSRVFDINQCEKELVKQFDPPDEQGTVALGFVTWEGHKYNYRQVRWDERQCEEANIVANKVGGTWDMDALANEWDVSDLMEWGFTEQELGIINEETPEIKDEPDEIPEQYMILIECKSEMEQAELLARFNDEGLECRALLS